MATYVVGDLQGHLEPLQRLLQRVRFDPTCDRLVLAGDVVNRGPQSLEVLRFIHARRDHVDVVLGNHDIYALARHAGVAKKQDDDTLGPLLAAPDAPVLFDWLRQQYLLFQVNGVAVVHAGLPPGWTPDDVRREAAHVRDVLSSSEWGTLLDVYFGDVRMPSPSPLVRAAATIRLFTRLRFVDEAGQALRGSSAPENPPTGGVPWFRHAARPRGWDRIVFGHWAALGLWVEGDIACIDTGYTWGGALTGLRLDDGALFAIQSARTAKGG